MDIASLAGLVGTVIVIFVAIALEGGNPLSYINAPAALMSIGGSFMAVLVAYPTADVKKIMAGVKKLISQEHVDLKSTIDVLVDMCEKVRREGLLALDSMTKTIEDPFLAKGARCVVDGFDPDSTRAILEADMEAKKHRHHIVRSMFELMGNVAPGYALVGTLLGLVAMLANLDPETVGHKMSLALLCTLYGCGLANAVFIPSANKLKLKSDEEIWRCKLVIEGLLVIQAGENPRTLRERLEAFLPVNERTASDRTAEA